MLNGRMVDAYSNIQTLKLFARDEENDRYMRQGFDILPGDGAAVHALHHRRTRLDGAAFGYDDRHDGGSQRASVAGRAVSAPVRLRSRWRLCCALTSFLVG